MTTLARPRSSAPTRGAARLVVATLLGCGSASPSPEEPATRRAPAAATPCATVVACEEACGEGGVEACSRAARLMRQAPLDATLPRLVAALTGACDGKQVRACMDLATLHLAAPGLPRDEARARTFVERACELDDPVACLTFAREEIESAPLPPSAPKAASPTLKRALDLARAACDRGDGQACALYAKVLEIFPTTEAEHASYAARGSELLESSCLGGKGDHCMMAALQIAGPGFDRQPSRVRRALQRGCDLLDNEACLQLAANMPKSELAAKEAIYRGACARDSDEACIILGKAERDGLVQAKDETRGERLLARGIDLARARCGLGEENGCRNLARAVPLQAMALEDARATVIFLQGVCARRSPLVCNDLAEAVDAGPPGLRDAALVKTLKEAACEYGYPFACPDPIAKLGIYAPPDANIVDRRTGLEWARSPDRPTSAAEAPFACPAPARLPTRKELESLLDDGGKPRPFAKATTPPGGRLFSSDRAGGPDGHPWVLDVATGTITASEGSPALARCVRPQPRGGKPTRPTLSLRASAGVNLELAVRGAKEEVLFAMTIVRPAEALSLGQIWQPDKVTGQIDVEVSPEVDWSLAARLLRDAVKQGLTLRRIWVDAKPAARLP